ncbi:hypothetical protein BDF22DRAFT_775003 [Syncephalis plumigaleata]|nr:hypothetical protein BDF22DRAFT_775003 [Syncephalis plumigaleata]
MHSLLHHRTLTLIATTVLALISCVAQTQAVGGHLTGPDNPNSYARQYMDRVAASEGLSRPKWYGGGTNEISFAQVFYNNNQPGFLKCNHEEKEEKAFEALVAARDRLTGINKEYRNHVALPVKRIKIPQLPTQPKGNCFVYRFIGGDELLDYMFNKDYAEELISINLIMPQMLKGFIYLYNAGIAQRDLNKGNIMVQGQLPGPLHAFVIDFDIVEALPRNRRLIDINPRPTMGNGGSTDPYDCGVFYQAPLRYMPAGLDRSITLNVQTPTPLEERMKIQQLIIQRVKHSPQPTKDVLDKAIDAYISLSQVATILTRSTNCASLITALKKVYRRR